MALKGKSNEEKIWNFLKSKIQNDYGVAGLMGNLYAESGLRPANLENVYVKSLGMSDEEYTKAVDDGTYKNFVKDSAGYGLAQWTWHSRKQNLLNYAKSNKKSIGDLEMQLTFLWDELSSRYKSVVNTLKTAKTVLEASNSVLFYYEAPADQSEKVQKQRASFGQKYYDKYVSASSSTSTKDETNTTGNLKVGDIVNFTGDKHYTSSYAGGKALKCKSGKAKVTAISKGQPHPYHLVAVSGSGSTVYGWVDIVDIEGATGSGSDINVGDIVKYSGTVHYTSSYEGAASMSCKGGQAKVTKISKGKPHPYHLVHTGSGCTVYGWVDADKVSK